ncbi:MOSC domain-containing protein [Halovenus sp. WSH3]|uniref:MOSC domain-containing protein n=1 Tax=Halovenus carboxidivorans TaxID=2692199 RepID=A0A6B0T186_9EURY|nr:MOSC N-terminal beta barrel domain-containing protein [Halovenus carboxidivorans]MXR50937.1 MOSC domain-containing protein [Halovenus carboxidivorans]
MPEIEKIRVYPVKGLDGIELEQAEITDGGTLAYDREFALFEDDEIVNAKDSEKFHDLSTTFDPEHRELEVTAPDGERLSFALATDADRERAQEWFSEYFGTELRLRRNTELGYVDRRTMGPSVISTATLETVASWFDDLTVESARRRLRANIEISGVEPFWEDRFVGDDAPVFEADGVRFEGVTPCGRCVVPQRDPDTGEPLEQFRRQFIEQRRESFPEFADEAAFDHFYTLMIITRIPESDRTERLAVGDPVEDIEAE